MTAIDPYRTLGLTPGASQAEIKRAYRRLAKLYHPDSAGERALPRFLAIQAAYEALVEDPGRRRAGRAGRPTGRPSPRSRPGRPTPSRARATREAYRARTRRRPAGEGRAGPSAQRTDPPGAGTAGSRGRPGAGPAGRGSRAGTRRHGRAPWPGRERAPGLGRRPDPARPVGLGGAAAEGHDRLDELRRRGQGAVRPGLGGGDLVRRRERDLLDDQPEGVRRPAEARSRVPRPVSAIAGRPAADGRRRRTDWRRTDESGAAADVRPTATASGAPDPAAPPKTSAADRVARSTAPGRRLRPPARPRQLGRLRTAARACPPTRPPRRSPVAEPSPRSSPGWPSRRPRPGRRRRAAAVGDSVPSASPAGRRCPCPAGSSSRSSAGSRSRSRCRSRAKRVPACSGSARSAPIR